MVSCQQCQEQLADPTEPCEKCGFLALRHAVVLAALFVKGSGSASKRIPGVMILCGDKVTFLPRANPSSALKVAGTIAVALAGVPVPDADTSYLIDDMPLEAYIKFRIPQDDPEAFDAEVQTLFERVGGVRWTPAACKLALDENGLVTIDAGVQQLHAIEQTLAVDVATVSQFVETWPAGYRHGEPAEYQPPNNALDASPVYSGTVRSGSLPNTSTVETWWKQHECAECGATFAYPVKVNRPNFNYNSSEWLAQRVKNLVESHPCPECGLIQPEMLGPARIKRHERWLVMTLLICSVPLGLLLVECLSPLDFHKFFGGLQPWICPVAVWTSTAICAFGLWRHYRAARWNPNSDLATNKMRAEAELLSGTVHRLTRRTVHAPVEHRPSLRAPQVTALLLCLAGLLAGGLGETVRSVAGWQRNVLSMPPIIGTGETAWLYTKEEIPCLEYLWRGRAELELIDAARLKLPADRLPASTKENHWGEEIDVGEAINQGARVWLKVKFPDWPQLSGQATQTRLRADVVYPRVGRFRFTEETVSISEVRTIYVSSPYAGWVYEILAIGGSLSALLLFMIAGIMFAATARRIGKEGNSVLDTRDPSCEPC